MKLLTENQYKWLHCQKISVGRFYFPSMSFTVYKNNDYTEKIDIDYDYTKQSPKDYFLVKEILPNGLCRVNLLDNIQPKDFYISELDLSWRFTIARLFLYATCYIPMAIYNKLKKHD